MKRISNLLQITACSVGILCVLPLVALATERVSAEEQLKEFADYNLSICGTGARRAIEAWRAGQQVDEQYEFGDCIADARVEGKRLYSAALVKVSGNKLAEQALKDYFATWLTAMTNIKPNGYESIGSYNDRQSDYSAKVELLWSKFELEN